MSVNTGYIKLNHTVTNILFVSDLRQVCSFLCVLRFPPPQYMTKILLKVALNTITHIYWKVYNWSTVIPVTYLL